MADKKITALTAATSAASEDLLHIIDDPGGSPVNKKLTVQNFLNSITHTSTGTATANTETLLSLTHTANADPVTTGTPNKLNNVASLQVTSTATGAAAGNMSYDRFYAADISNKVADGNTVIVTESAGARITLDRNAEDSTGTVNAHCLILRHANTVSDPTTSAPRPTSFLKFEAGSGTNANVSNIMDIFSGGAYGISDGASATVSSDLCATTGTKATTGGYLRIRILGQTRYINLFTG